MTALRCAAIAAIAAASVISTAAAAATKEISVFGLNCGPCGEQLRTQMQETAGATDLVAQLECGRIFVELPDGATLNHAGLSLLLLSKGYTLKGVKDSQVSVAQAREMGEAVCKMS